MKNEIFMAKGEGESTSVADVNKCINEILVKIRQKWQNDLQLKPSEPEKKSAYLPMEEPQIDQAETDLPEDDIIKETVILSADDFRTKPPSLEVADDHVPETIIAKPEPAQPPETPILALQPTDDVEETPAPPKPQESDIPETVIFSPQKSPSSVVYSEEKQSAETNNSQLGEQTISNTNGEQQSKKEPANEKEKDDDIPETMIFKPDKNKDNQ
jgi:hypothetical protein